MVVMVLALTSAALSAVSAAGQQRAAARLACRSRETARPGAVRVGAFALALVTTPLWLVSWALDAGAFFVQAAALHLGSLSVVQPLMVSTLLFTVPLAAAHVRRAPTAREWLGVAAVSLGLVLVLSTRSRSDGGEVHSGGMLPAAMGAVVAIVVILVLVSRGRSAPVRAALLGVSAGALFGVGAAATKLVAAGAAADGFTGVLTSWPGYALAVASVASFGLQQGAYATGPLATVMTAVVVSDPLTSYVLGVVGFGEAGPDGAGAVALAALGMLVLALGVAVLARSPLLQPHTEAQQRNRAPERQEHRLPQQRRAERPAAVGACGYPLVAQCPAR